MGTIRLIIALAVVSAHIGHEGWPYIGSTRAIHAFMIIAGFYAAMLLGGRYSSGLRPLRAFYFSRFARLYPTFIISVGLTVCWSWWAMSSFRDLWDPAYHLMHRSENLSIPASVLLWAPNITLLGADIPALLNLADGSRVEIAAPWPEPPCTEEWMWLGYTLLIPPSWSLGMILWFYLAAPLVARPPRILAASVWGLVSMGCLLAFGSLFFYGGYFVAPFWFWLFCLGVLSQMGWSRFRGRLDRWMATARTRIAVFAFCILFFVWCFTMDAHLGTVLRALLTALVLPLAAASSSSSALDRYMGKLSYPVFCGHMLVVSVTSAITVSLGVSHHATLPAAMLGTLLYAALLVRYVEEPLEPLRARASEWIRTGARPTPPAG